MKGHSNPNTTGTKKEERKLLFLMERVYNMPVSIRRKMASTENSKRFLKVLYTVFLAALIALFFGLGVSAFYPAPKQPEYPVVLEKQAPGEGETEEVRQARVQNERDQKQYQEKISPYNRNVSMITLGLAVFALVVSLVFANKIPLLTDGLMLGGLFTLIYSIGRGFATEDARYRFVIVSIGLLVTVAIGYIKFIKPREED